MSEGEVRLSLADVSRHLIGYLWRHEEDLAAPGRLDATEGMLVVLGDLVALIVSMSDLIPQPLQFPLLLAVAVLAQFFK